MKIKIFGELYRQALEVERKKVTQAYLDKETSISAFEEDYWGHIDRDTNYLEEQDNESQKSNR